VPPLKGEVSPAGDGGVPPQGPLPCGAPINKRHASYTSAPAPPLLQSPRGLSLPAGSDQGAALDLQAFEKA